MTTYLYTLTPQLGKANEGEETLNTEGNQCLHVHIKREVYVHRYVALIKWGYGVLPAKLTLTAALSGYV